MQAAGLFWIVLLADAGPCDVFRHFVLLRRSTQNV